MKNYTFADCINYANTHNISFTFYSADSTLHYLYCDVSDGNDGYLTATEIIFEYNNFDKMYHAHMNLNIRYAFKKDYELMRRLEIAINKHRRVSMEYCNATFNHGTTIWYGK